MIRVSGVTSTLTSSLFMPGKSAWTIILRHAQLISIAGDHPSISSALPPNRGLEKAGPFPRRISASTRMDSLRSSPLDFARIMAMCRTGSDAVRVVASLPDRVRRYDLFLDCFSHSTLLSKLPVDSISKSPQPFQRFSPVHRCVWPHRACETIPINCPSLSTTGIRRT